MKTYSEIRTDHIDDDNFTHIDAWVTDNVNEEGKTIALFCNDTGKTIFFDNSRRFDPQIVEAIKELKSEWEKSCVKIENSRLESWIGDESNNREGYRNLVLELLNDGYEVDQLRSDILNYEI